MIAWTAGNMFWATAAMLLVLAIRRPVAAVLGAGAAYALWLVPALRLVAPPLDWFGDWFGADLSALAAPIVLIDPAAVTASLPPAGGPGQWVPIALAVWAGGAFLFLVLQAAAYRAFLRGLSLSLRSAGSHDGIPLLASDAVDGPLALGLLDRRIVVPSDFADRYSAAEQRLALDHEAFHHRRRDLLANHVALVVLALHWFNPVAWFAFRAFRADQELSCDAAVTGALPAIQRADYAHALVKSASRPGLIAACPLNRADQLKRRLKMLNHHRNGGGRRAAGLTLTAMLVCASLATAGHAQEQTAPKQREQIIIMQHRDGAPPADGARRPSFRTDRDGNVINRHLSPELAERLERCQAGGDLVDVNEGEGTNRTRLRICAPTGGAPADRVAALQRARERVAGQEALSAEVRQRVLAQLDQAIARARQ